MREIHQLQVSEASCVHNNAGLGLGSPSVPPVNTVPHGRPVESLWCKRRGLELSAKLFITACTSRLFRFGPAVGYWGCRNLRTQSFETFPLSNLRVGQNNTQSSRMVITKSPAEGNFGSVMPAFVVHSISFFPQFILQSLFFKLNGKCNVNSELIHLWLSETLTSWNIARLSS